LRKSAELVPGHHHGARYIQPPVAACCARCEDANSLWARAPVC
jgi:hypothetical protein